jgi:cell division protein FtsN
MAVKRGKKQARRKDEPSIPGYVWLLTGLLIGAAVAVGFYIKMPHAADGLLPHPNAAASPPTASASPAAPEGNPPAAEPAVKKPTYTFYALLPEKEVVIKDEELSAQVKAEAAANLASKQQAGLASPASGAATDGSTVVPKIPQATSPVASTVAPTTTSANPSTPTVTKANPPATPVASATPSAPATATPATPSTATAAALPEKSGQYLLQAGAFRNSAQADDLKARIAMLGLVGRVEVVQTPGGEMHRVRLGPYATASELNSAKEKLNGGGISSAVAIRVK